MTVLIFHVFLRQIIFSFNFFFLIPWQTTHTAYIGRKSIHFSCLVLWHICQNIKNENPKKESSHRQNFLFCEKPWAVSHFKIGHNIFSGHNIFLFRGNVLLYQITGKERRGATRREKINKVFVYTLFSVFSFKWTFFEMFDTFEVFTQIFSGSLKHQLRNWYVNGQSEWLQRGGCLSHPFCHSVPTIPLVVINKAEVYTKTWNKIVLFKMHTQTLVIFLRGCSFFYILNFVFPTG